VNQFAVRFAVVSDAMFWLAVAHQVFQFQLNTTVFVFADHCA
jgi:hypothetical protein